LLENQGTYIAICVVKISDDLSRVSIILGKPEFMRLSSAIESCL
jgi:hypothetical protein